ncbi:hypothetical protein [Spirosoma montaniterrae]|nr:hypothetical protein [Spirosoma montaniterrae]
MKTLLMALTFATLTTGAIAQTTKPVSTGAATTVAAPAEDKEKKDEFVERLFSEQSYLNAQIVDKCFTLKLSPTCWAAFTDPAKTGNDGGFGAMRYWVRYAAEYCKREGIGDLYELAVDDKKVEKENRPMIDEMIKNLRSKFSLTVEAPVECRGKAYEMMMRYPFEVVERIGYKTPEWSPKSGEAHFTVTVLPTAKDIAVKISPDGKQFMISGPAYVEAYSTADKIWNGLERANKNR